MELGFLEKGDIVNPQMRGNGWTGLERESKNGRAYKQA